MPLLELVAVIAERYEALDPIRSAFVSLCQDWQSKKTLWAAVATQPLRWLKLSVKLENELVYNEAFGHLAGSYPEFQGLEDLPAGIAKALEAGACQIRIMRYEINEQLAYMTPPDKGQC